MRKWFFIICATKAQLGNSEPGRGVLRSGFFVPGLPALFRLRGGLKAVQCGSRRVPMLHNSRLSRRLLTRVLPDASETMPGLPRTRA